MYNVYVKIYLHQINVSKEKWKIHIIPQKALQAYRIKALDYYDKKTPCTLNSHLPTGDKG